MLKTTVSSQVLAADEVLAANEVSVVEGGDESIEKSTEPKTGKLSKSKKLSKSRKAPIKLMALVVVVHHLNAKDKCIIQGVGPQNVGVERR